MKITSVQLKGWHACKEGYEWFVQNFPKREAGYQEVLNGLAEDDLPDYAEWLIHHAGPDLGAEINTETLFSKKHLFFAGSLIVKNGIAVKGKLLVGLDIDAGGHIAVGEGIQAGGHICAGEDIHAGGSIKVVGCIGAGGNIKAKGSINAIGGISAGRDIVGRGDIAACQNVKAGGGIGTHGNIEVCRGFGIFAGQRIHPDNWPRFARVMARTPPGNLISGYWVDRLQKIPTPHEVKPDTQPGITLQKYPADIPFPEKIAVNQR